MTATLYRATRLLQLLCAGALLWLAGCGQALAALTVTAVTVNGSATTAYVTPGTTVQVAVTVTLTNGTRWWSTAIYTSPSSSMNFCTTGPDVSYTGSRTYTFNVTAPSTQNIYSLVVAAHSNNNCTNGGERGTRTTASAIDTRPVVAGVDHLQIEHDGSGRSCAAKTVTIKACGDLACTTLHTPSTSVTLTANNSASWSPSSLSFTGGTATALLSKTANGTVTVGGTISAPTPKSATTCLRSGVLGSCDIVFSALSCSLDAVEAGKAPGTPIFTKHTGGFSVDVLTLNGSGALATSTATISARLVEDVGCGTASPTNLSADVTGTFNGSRLSYTFAPLKASRSARVRMVNGALIGCSTDKFAIRPVSFTIVNPGSGGANADDTGASASAAPAIKAGNAFTLLANSFAGYDGKPAFTNDRLAAADIGSGVAGTAGYLDEDFSSFATSVNGVATGSFKYSEVGYFKLQPYAVYDDGSFALVDSVADECIKDGGALAGGGTVSNANTAVNGKIGCYFGNTDSTYFGRFTPDRFVLGTPTLLNRSATATCSAATFSYMGETMLATVPLTAVNVAGELTSNYSGTFNRMATPATQLGLGAINDAPAPPLRTPFPLCGATEVHPCIKAGVAGGSFALGQAAFTVPLTLFRPGSPVGPFDFLQIGVAPADLDAIKLDPATYNLDTVTVPAASSTKNHVQLGATSGRYGRLNIDNAYGSELLNLALRVSAQYWNASGYASNLLDSCTPLLKANFTMSNYLGGLAPSQMDVNHITIGTPMTNGAGKLLLTKPGPVVPVTKGSVDVKAAGTILPGQGRATFGVYKAGPVIYQRETY